MEGPRWTVTPVQDSADGSDFFCMINLEERSFTEALDELFRFGGSGRPPGTFGEMLKTYMHDVDISVEELAFRSKISERTLSSMRNKEDYQPELNSVISLCIGMGLNPSDSYKLISTAGYSLNESKLHKAYKLLIDKASGATIDECNYFLKKAKLPPL